MPQRAGCAQRSRKLQDMKEAEDVCVDVAARSLAAVAHTRLGSEMHDVGWRSCRERGKGSRIVEVGAQEGEARLSQELSQSGFFEPRIVVGA